MSASRAYVVVKAVHQGKKVLAPQGEDWLDGKTNVLQCQDPDLKEGDVVQIDETTMCRIGE